MPYKLITASTIQSVSHAIAPFHREKELIGKLVSV